MGLEDHWNSLWKDDTKTSSSLSGCVRLVLHSEVAWNEKNKKDWKGGTPGTSDIMFQSYSVIV